MEDLEVDRVLVVWLKCNSIPVEFLREVLRFEFVPLIRRRSIRLVLFKSLPVKLRSLINSLMGQDVLIGLNAELFAVRSIKLVLDESLILSVSIIVRLFLQFFNLLIKVSLTVRLGKFHGIGGGS